MENPIPQSPTTFVLKALIPYSRQNLMLAFKPSQFFYELERASNYKRKTLEQAVRRAEQKGLIRRMQDRSLRLTELGQRRALPYMAKHLPHKSRLMVIFDIPEDMSTTRKQFRRLLKKWQFEQVQKSVWVSAYDHRESIRLATDEFEISSYVEIFECSSFD